jgi:hypothetical protein
MRSSPSLLLLILTLGCNETGLGRVPIPTVAPPPELPTADFGDPPDWNDCFQGFLGDYANLPITHPDVEPLPGVLPVDEIDPATLDWWDEPTFQEFSPNLDFGGNWWPVDEGLEGDPAYFTVRFRSWLRAWDDTTMRFTLGHADDVFIKIGDEVVFSRFGVHDFEPETHQLRLDAGQFPFELLYAHRSGESGLRFRVLEGDVSLCLAEQEE